MNETKEVQKVVSDKENKDEKFKKPKLDPTLVNFSASVKLWWKNINNFLKIYAWALLYSAIAFAGALLITFLLNLMNHGIFVIVFSFIVVIAASLASLYFFIRAFSAFILYIKNDYKGDPKQLFMEESKKYVADYIILSILTTILILFWSLFLIVPGIIFSIFYSFAIFVYFFEGKTNMKALNRSRDLVKGYAWPVLWRSLLIAFILMVFSTIISFPINFMEKYSLMYDIWNIVVSVITFIIIPIVTIYSINIYKNLVKVKD